MTRTPALATALIDLPLILITLVGTVWLTTRNDRVIELALGFPSSQWLYDMDTTHKENMARNAQFSHQPPPLTPREEYARKFPQSPISRINQSPRVFAVEQALQTGVERASPALILAGITLGIVVVRRAERPGRGCRRRRWGPGRVAAGIGLVVASVLFLNDFLIRTSYLRLGQRGDYHDATIASWLTIARVAGTAILAAWLMLLVTGRWRLASGWRERLGLALGIGWLLMLAWLVVLGPLAQLE